MQAARAAHRRSRESSGERTQTFKNLAPASMSYCRTMYQKEIELLSPAHRTASLWHSMPWHVTQLQRCKSRKNNATKDVMLCTACPHVATGLIVTTRSMLSSCTIEWFLERGLIRRTLAISLRTCLVKTRPTKSFPKVLGNGVSCLSSQPMRASRARKTWEPCSSLPSCALNQH
jgi:hypothetical protein